MAAYEDRVFDALRHTAAQWYKSWVASSDGHRWFRTLANSLWAILRRPAQSDFAIQNLDKPVVWLTYESLGRLGRPQRFTVNVWATYGATIQVSSGGKDLCLLKSGMAALASQLRVSEDSQGLKVLSVVKHMVEFNVINPTDIVPAPESLSPSPNNIYNVVTFVRKFLECKSQ